MNHKIKNFLTFGMYDRLVQAECEVIQLKEAISKVQSTDIDSMIEDEISRRNILTEDNFSPSDYDLVQSYDYDFDTFMNEDEVAREVEVRIDEFKSEMFDEVKNQVEDAQKLVIIQTVKQVCTEMLVDWCKRTAEAANKQEETDSSSDNS